MAVKGRHRRKTTTEGKSSTKNSEKKYAGKQTLHFDWFAPHFRHRFITLISTMMEPSNAILENETTNRRYEISPRDQVSYPVFLLSVGKIRG